MDQSSPISGANQNSEISNQHIESAQEVDNTPETGASTINGGQKSTPTEVATPYQNDQDPNNENPTTKDLPRLATESLSSNLSRYGAPRSSSLNGSQGSLDSPEDDEESWRSKLSTFWLQNKGVFLVLLAQIFAAFMNVMTRLLEMNGPDREGMHPFQILFARMSITVLCSAIYMWYTKVEHPLGESSVRALLITRGVSGFFGVCGLYYSLQYLPLSEATVLTFMAPIVACYACSFLMPNEPFTRRQQLAAVVSLVGVVLIARPGFLFPNQSAPDAAMLNVGYSSTSPTSSPDKGLNHVSPHQRVLAIMAGLIGVLGAGCAYTTIRWIGKRAHPLVSVTYFSALTTVITAIALATVPAVPFRFPGNATEWILLSGLGSCGFALQFLLTAGLSYVPPPLPTKYAANGRPMTPKPSSGHGTRATSMVYSQMIFALFFDKVIWNSSPSPLSWAGSALILGSTIYVALVKEGGKKKALSKEEQEVDDQRRTWREEGNSEEGRGLLEGDVERVNYESTRLG